MNGKAPKADQPSRDPSVVTRGVCAAARDEAQAQEVMHRLQDAGVNAEGLWAIYPNEPVSPPSAGRPVATGIGWFSGVGGLTYPGMESLVAGGPVAAPLPEGGPPADARQALLGLGMDNPSADVALKSLRQGEVLIGTRCAADVQRARRIFEEAGARLLPYCRQPHES